MAGYLWSQLDRFTHGGGSFISNDEVCMFYMERMHGGFDRCEANQLICNLKMGRKVSAARLRYRNEAIRRFSHDLHELINQLSYDGPIVLVPIPPSKSPDDPEYDGRMVEVCEIVQSRYGIPFVDLLYQKSTHEPYHSSGNCRDPETIYRDLEIREIELPEDFKVIMLVDDVLTTGAHYLACKRKILERFPDVFIVGAFWARQMTHEEELGASVGLPSCL